MHILLITGFLRPLNLGSFYSLILRVQSSNQQLLTLDNIQSAHFDIDRLVRYLDWIALIASSRKEIIFEPFLTEFSHHTIILHFHTPHFHTFLERLEKSRFFVEHFSTEQLETSVRSRGYEKWSIIVVFFRLFKAFLQIKVVIVEELTI